MCAMLGSRVQTWRPLQGSSSKSKACCCSSPATQWSAPAPHRPSVVGFQPCSLVSRVPWMPLRPRIRSFGPMPHPAARGSRLSALPPLAMINVDFASPSLVLGIALIGCGVALLQARNLQQRVSRDADIVVAAMISIVGSTLIFQGWRLDPLLLLCQALTTSVALWYGLEAFKLRAQVEEQAEEEEQAQLPPPEGFYGRNPSEVPSSYSRGATSYLPPSQETRAPWGAAGGRPQGTYAVGGGASSSSSSSDGGRWGAAPRYDQTVRYDYYGNPMDPPRGYDEPGDGVLAQLPPAKSPAAAAAGQARPYLPAWEYDVYPGAYPPGPNGRPAEGGYGAAAGPGAVGPGPGLGDWSQGYGEPGFGEQPYPGFQDQGVVPGQVYPPRVPDGPGQAQGAPGGAGKGPQQQQQQQQGMGVPARRDYEKVDDWE